MLGIIKKAKNLRINVLSMAARCCPIHDNKIIFWSELGFRYSCNPRYLCEYIMNNYPDRFDIVWMFDRGANVPSNLPQGIRIVRFFSREWLYEIATSKYIVCNHRIPEHFMFKKRSEQVYIQTWHSSLRLKCIEKDAGETLGKSYISSAISDSRQIDYIISGCSFSTNIFRNSFWYNGKILESGTPRVDYLLNQSKNKSKLYLSAGLDEKVHYVLYAPTFRKGDSTEAYNIDICRLVHVLKNKWGGDWKVLYRLHPNLAERVKIENLPDCCIDMTKYHDMQELLLLSEILITDYSSSMFDMAYLDKLCILYVSDLKEYVAQERKLYFNIEELPFFIARNNDELQRIVEHIDVVEYKKELDLFMRRIGSFENGTACKKILSEIFNT